MKKKRSAQEIQYHLQRDIRHAVALQGFALRHVLATGSQPAYSYTIGLYRAELRPELFISGLSLEARVAWLLDLGFRMQGPPSQQAQRRIARQSGVAPSAQVYPPGGETFEPGRIYRTLADGGLPYGFGLVEPRYYSSHCGQALVYHDGAAFPMLQMVWPDTRGIFPWQPSFERRFLGKQQLLFDPEQY